MVTHSLATVRELKILVLARTTFFYIPALLGCCFQIVSTITRLNHRNLIVLGSWALFSLSFFRLRMVGMGIIVFRHQCTSFSAQLTRTCCIPRSPPLARIRTVHRRCRIVDRSARSLLGDARPQPRQAEAFRFSRRRG